MQIVIDIPEKEYLRLKEPTALYWDSVLYKAIANGTPLPKGHGVLKDASKMIADLNVSISLNNSAKPFEWIRDAIDSYPTIIEADTEVDE